MSRKFTIPYQNLTFEIPEVGEIFRTDDDYGVYKMTENGVISYDVGGEGKTKQGEREALINQKIGQDRGSLTKYNAGDMMTALNAMGITSWKSVNDVSQFTPTPVKNTNEVITQTISPNNPNGVDVNSNLKGNLATSPSTEENQARALKENKGGTMAETDKPIRQIGNVSSIPSFERQLQFGDSGEDVKQLQKFLNESGFIVAKDGEAGSPGNETTYFGPATQKALQEYQKSQGIVSKGDPQSTGFGRLGPQTIKSVNSLITKGSGAVDTTGATGTQNSSTEQNSYYKAIPQDTELDGQLEQLLSNPNIGDDQKAMIQQIYDVVSSNDINQAEKIAAAFKAASQFSDPYFKAQVSLAMDALTRGTSALQGDLEFEERQLQQTLQDLKTNLEASGAELDFQQAQDLKQLEKSYAQDLENTVQNLAAVGKTSSSVRSKSEQLLREESEGLVESTNRKYSYQKGLDERNLSQAQRDTQQELARLQDKTTQQNISNLRQTEQKVGSTTMANAGYSNLLGNIGGDIPRQKTLDATSFANSFVF